MITLVNVRPGTVDLEILARSVLAEMVNDMKLNDYEPYFLAVHDADVAFRFRLGSDMDLMNRGSFKDALFDCFRAIPDIEAWVFGASAWTGEATEEGKKHIDEFRGLSTDKLVSRGWIDRKDSIVVLAQNEQECFQLIQIVHETEFVGLPNVHRMNQSQFGGRFKMWGATEDDKAGMV